MSGVLRGFPSAEYDMYASTKTLVRPCSSEKVLIYELETYLVPNTCYVIYGWALTNYKNSRFVKELQTITPPSYATPQFHA